VAINFSILYGVSAIAAPPAWWISRESAGQVDSSTLIYSIRMSLDISTDICISTDI